MNPLVSVILTTRNNEHILERCLRAVAQQSYPKIELIVVDNFSTDRTAELARHYTVKVYSKGPERSAQRNYGAQHATGQYLFFIDSDMELGKDTVKQCVDVAQQGYGALMVAEHFIGRGYWSKCKALEKRCYTGTGDAEAARFVRRDFFQKIGGYDAFLTGPEDLDFHKRIACVTRVGRAPGIVHYDEHLTFFSLVRKRYYYSRSLKRYFAKHPEARQKEFRFVRLAFLQQWRVLLADPLHLLGFLILRVGEGFATVLALWFS